MSAMFIKRYIPLNVENYAFNETLTSRHMMLLAGPRQVGKTVLTKRHLEISGTSSLYYNGDDIVTRKNNRLATLQLERESYGIQ